MFYTESLLTFHLLPDLCEPPELSRCPKGPQTPPVKGCYHPPSEIHWKLGHCCSHLEIYPETLPLPRSQLGYILFTTKPGSQVTIFGER